MKTSVDVLPAEMRIHCQVFGEKGANNDEMFSESNSHRNRKQESQPIASNISRITVPNDPINRQSNIQKKYGVISGNAEKWEYFRLQHHSSVIQFLANHALGAKKADQLTISIAAALAINFSRWLAFRRMDTRRSQEKGEWNIDSRN
jgi:hypothetical protein